MKLKENRSQSDNASMKKENVEKITEVGAKSVEEKSSKKKTPQATIEELRSELDKKLKEKDKLIEEWKKKFMLMQADFENYQKRMEKNRIHIQSIERAAILRDFLRIMDSFEKAIDHIDNTQESNFEDIKSIYNQLLNQFKRYEVEQIPASKGDLFDYKIHEAISHIENADLPENSIVDILQTGWKIGNVILRYSKVIISKIPKEPEPEQDIDKKEEEKEKKKEKNQYNQNENNNEKINSNKNNN